VTHWEWRVWDECPTPPNSSWEACRQQRSRCRREKTEPVRGVPRPGAIHYGPVTNSLKLECGPCHRLPMRVKRCDPVKLPAGRALAVRRSHSLQKHSSTAPDQRQRRGHGSTSPPVAPLAGPSGAELLLPLGISSPGLHDEMSEQLPPRWECPQPRLSLLCVRPTRDIQVRQEREREPRFRLPSRRLSSDRAPCGVSPESTHQQTSSRCSQGFQFRPWWLPSARPAQET